MQDSTHASELQRQTAHRLIRLQGRDGAYDYWTGAQAHGRDAELATMLPDFVFGSNHPCVMARSILQRGAVRIGVHAGFDGVSAAGTCDDLYECLSETRVEEGTFVSYVALFPDAVACDEVAFESALWQHLQAMHDVDREHHGWDPTVASDPQDDAFSFSIGARAWYVVGLHPQASRLARRFPVPALVFNPHAQFEALREEGKYMPLRDRIRQRDHALQGSANPVLVDHGRDSEAKQYSGRAVDGEWQCPFVPGRRNGHP